MAVLYSLEWVVERAVAALLQNCTALINIYVSDDTDNRVRPSASIMCTKCEERKIGRLQTANGGYLSGVFNVDVEVLLEQKADLVVKPSQNAMPEEESSKLWQQIWQAFHWDTLLADRLTNGTTYPFTCYDARINEGEYTVDAERRIWQKRFTLNLIAMPRDDN